MLRGRAVGTPGSPAAGPREFRDPSSAFEARSRVCRNRLYKGECRQWRSQLPTHKTRKLSRLIIRGPNLFVLWEVLNVNTVYPLNDFNRGIYFALGIASAALCRPVLRLLPRATENGFDSRMRRSCRVRV